VPETKQWGDQAKTWRSACRSRLREEELEFEGESAAECDREEDDPQGESEFPEPNLGPSEDVDQRISYHRDNFRNCGDDEPSLGSTESIDQTHCAEGAPHELEADAFPYDPPRRAGDAPDYIVTSRRRRAGPARPWPALWVPRALRPPPSLDGRRDGRALQEEIIALARPNGSRQGARPSAKALGFTNFRGVKFKESTKRLKTGPRRC
jgi:hypothetical protein